MKKSLLALALILSFPLASSLSYAKTDFTPISKEEIHKLQDFFKESISISDAQLEKTWSCKLYGMRSHFQTRQEDSFYKFKTKKVNSLTNDGTQLISHYEKTERELIGQIGPMKERIRMNKSGQLVSEISLPEARKRGFANSKIIHALNDPKRSVLAYALCN